MPAAKPPEFGRRARDLVGQGVPVAQVAQDLGISGSCPRRWLAVDEVDAGRRDAVTCSERGELIALRRRKPVLEMEIEILKRRSAYVAREDTPDNSDPAGP